jgi:hypothetical protein
VFRFQKDVINLDFFLLRGFFEYLHNNTSFRFVSLYYNS